MAGRPGTRSASEDAPVALCEEELKQVHGGELTDGTLAAETGGKVQSYRKPGGFQIISAGRD